MPNPDASSSNKPAASGLLPTLRIRILGLSRGMKQLTMIVADSAGFAASAFIATWLLFSTGVSLQSQFLLAAAAICTTLPATWLLGLYRSVIRYMGVELFVAALKASIAASVVLGLVTGVVVLVPDPLRWTIAYGAITLIYIVGSRMAARIFLNRRNTNREQVLIYGAGQGGARLAAALFNGDDYLPVAMIDDNLSLHGKRIQGLEVFPPSRLGSLVESTGATAVLLAMPSASRRRRRSILEQLSQYAVHVMTVPEITDLISGRSRVDDLRDVDVNDLLGRDQVPPNEELLRGCVSGANVLVTGAGGSIGSELCRQIVRLNPKRLVCFEISEPALYDLDRELRGLIEAEGLKCELVGLLGSVHSEGRVREVLDAFDIETVYHAAAYKHVPIVEHNLFEGVHNNVFGTLHTARAARDAGVSTFVLVSTDKAVNPTSVMGATKRLAEQILQAFNEQSPNTRFCMVRFGNVLESSGSVVPLFRQQIRDGGPVTVTHRDIIRYFMTIPEASQLVIQAGSMARGGDVFVLDMGSPVRIQDLARRMIQLMGLSVRDDAHPDGDIEIKFVGLRPAEKLYEELLIGSNASGTEHPRIMRADEDCLPFDELMELLGRLKEASAKNDYHLARDLLLRAVEEYRPNNGIDDLIWLKKTGTDAGSEGKKVVDFPQKDKE